MIQPIVCFGVNMVLGEPLNDQNEISQILRFFFTMGVATDLSPERNLAALQAAITQHAAIQTDPVRYTQEFERALRVARTFAADFSLKPEDFDTLDQQASGD